MKFIKALHVTTCMFPEQHLKLSALVVTNRVQGLEQMPTTVAALAAMCRMNLSDNNSIVRASPIPQRCCYRLACYWTVK